MKVTHAIEERRAVKHYDPNHRMTEAEIDELLRLARLAPTAYNIQNWRFVVVREPALRKRIRAVAQDQAQVTDASLLIVLCADLKSWEKNPARYWANAPKPIQDYMVSAIDGYYRDREQVQRDEGMRSCGMAAQTIMLAAKAMGYDSCPMDGFDYDAVGKLIGLPRNHAVAMFVVVGKAAQPPWERPTLLPTAEVVFRDQF